MVEGAFDINEVAWDPSRDSANERLSLLAELDAITVAHASQLLDPAVRTFGGEPLGVRRTELLLGCTFDDLEVMVNRINAGADYDDDDERAGLADARGELSALLGRYRLLKRDSDDDTIERMTVEDRRRARVLQQRVDRLRRQRYDPLTAKRRRARAAVPRLRAALERAREESDATEAARLERLLTHTRSELEALDELAQRVVSAERP